jgi:molybdenum cofactor cytidylyltransferase
MSGVVGILLAAGSSRRFGSDKRWHSLPDGTPMALASARHLLAACPTAIAVIRPNDQPLAELLGAAGLSCIVCPEAEHGMGHSLATGVAATAGASGWLVALADMPFIQPDSYRVVIAALERGARMARPAFEGRVGHPVGFADACRDDLLALRGDQGGKAIIEANPTTLVRCPVDNPGVLQDVDHPSAAATARH